MIGEHLYFQNGMSLLDLMEARAKPEIFSQFRHWNAGFCFHSDFYLSIWTQLYHLSAKEHVEPLRPESTLIYQDQNGYARKTRGDCLYTSDLPCNLRKAVSCHYQSPSAMETLNQEWNVIGRSVLAKLFQPNSVAFSPNHLSITPRRFTNDKNDPSLVRLSSPHEVGREALSLPVHDNLMVVVGGYIGGDNGYDGASSLIQFFNTTSQQWLPRNQ